MKTNNNIHILPTDKPSRLYYTISMNGYVLHLSEAPKIKSSQLRPQHIYITSSDEEIKSNCWALNVKTNTLYKTYGGKGFNEKDEKNDWRKVILTTEELLIKDGIQAIPDEFLEWFVKNPSCEFVQIINGLFSIELGQNHSSCVWKYKIIIPKEEPKQDFYKKGDFHKDCDDCCKYYCTKGNTQFAECLLEEPKQENLEEVAEIEKLAMDKLKSRWEHLYTFGYPKRPFPTNYENDLNNIKIGLYEGFKLQAERMYSKEEVLDAWELGAREGLPLTRKKKEELFNKFKKK